MAAKGTAACLEMVGWPLGSSSSTLVEGHQGRLTPSLLASLGMGMVDPIPLLAP